MKLKFGSAVFLMFFLLIYCGGKDSKVDQDFDFAKLDNSLLGIETSDQDLGIKFSSPINWKFQSASLSRKIEETKNFSDVSQNYSYQPVYLFFDDSTGSVLSVGKVDNGDSTSSAEFKRNQYKNILNNKYTKDTVIVKEFNHSKITYSLIKFERNSLISYKLLFTNHQNGLIMFDFTLRKSYFESELEKIKASVASISLVK